MTFLWFCFDLVVNACSQRHFIALPYAAASSRGILEHYLLFENCITFAMCSSTVSTGQCHVKYSKDPTYPTDADSFDGPINQLFMLPLLERSTLYYHEAHVSFNSSQAKLIVRGRFMTGDCELCVVALSGHMRALYSVCRGCFSFTVYFNTSVRVQ